MIRIRTVVSLLVLGVGLLVAGFATTVAWGQAVTSASITGKATDESGASMPNVKVTATSPALQVHEVTTTTDGDGNYRLLDLPSPGVYRVSFGQAGFEAFVRDGVNLTVGFAARVDATMKVGEITQTVEVNGGSPVVDVVNTAGTTTLQKEQLETTPLGAGIQELLPLAAGVSMQGKPDVGDSNLASRSAIITYGVLLEPTMDVEGINITTSHDIDTGAYFDSYSLGEVEFKTSGNTADVAFPGVDMEAVMKSGSNSFHGRFLGDYENHSFQASNITPFLAAQGFKQTNPIQGAYTDYALGFGGRIIRDKLWFYVEATRQAVTQGSLGFVGGPDAAGCWSCGDAPPANITTNTPGYDFRGDYQLSHSTKLIGVWMHANKFLNANGASSTTPFPSTLIQHAPDNIWKGEVQSTLSSHLLVDALFGRGGYFVHYAPQAGMAVAGDPSSEELSTKVLTGPNPLATDRPQTRYEGKGSISYIRGSHQLKFGTDDTWEEAATKYPTENASGDYQLLFSSGKPFEVNIYNIPVLPINRLYSQAGFVTDTWSLKRVTLNLGVRAERYHSFYPGQSKPAGQFSAAATYSGATVSTWKDVVPRVGAAWDINGNGKTVLKGSFGMFGDTQGNIFANTFNPNALVTALYKWTGPCVATGFNNVSFTSPNTSCDASPAFLAGLTPSSPNYVSATGGLNELVNLNLKQDKTYEYVARLERQIAPNVAFSVSYVFHRVLYLYNSLESTTNSTANGVSVLRPYSAYTVPVSFTDALTGAPVTIYTYTSAYQGAAFNQLELVNAPGSRPDTYHSFDVAITKQYSKRFTALASFWVTKNHEWIQAISQSPNDDPFPLDTTWNWEARGDASYTFPHGFVLSSYFRSQSGVHGQRTEVFASTPTQTLLQGSVTRRMEPFGAEQGPVVSVLDVKVAKIFQLGERFRFQPSFQVFNLLNTSAATSTSYLTSTFGHTTGVVSPRVARIGAEFNF